MPMSHRARRVPPVFEPDLRPGAEESVYCKGCGTPLAGQPRHPVQRTKVTVMMCEPCREAHGHELVPRPGTPSFCYRCGGSDTIFIEPGVAPVTYRICPRCVPERAARYATGDFEEPVLPPPDPAATPAFPVAGSPPRPAAR